MVTYPNVKINLGLHVLRKREDGYHELETLFVPYSGISDTLEILPCHSECVPCHSDSVSCHSECVPCHSERSEESTIHITYPVGQYWPPEKDLVWKAYMLLKEDFGLPLVQIRLTKTSPVGAGLGGGSADAAFALRMLSQLFGLGLPAATLAAYAARLGSDCPFFIYNAPMMGRGRGEILTPFNLEEVLSPEEYEIKVVVPQDIHVSTADAYRGIVPREARSHKAPTPLEEILRTPVSQWKDTLVNDFESTVFAKYPALAEIKASLYEKGAVYASMSGSGSALFGIFRK